MVFLIKIVTPTKGVPMVSIIFPRRIISAIGASIPELFSVIPFLSFNIIVFSTIKKEIGKFEKHIAKASFMGKSLT